MIMAIKQTVSRECGWWVLSIRCYQSKIPLHIISYLKKYVQDFLLTPDWKENTLKGKRGGQLGIFFSPEFVERVRYTLYLQVRICTGVAQYHFYFYLQQTFCLNSNFIVIKTYKISANNLSWSGLRPRRTM